MDLSSVIVLTVVGVDVVAVVLLLLLLLLLVEGDDSDARGRPTGCRWSTESVAALLE